MHQHPPELSHLRYYSLCFAVGYRLYVLLRIEHWEDFQQTVALAALSVEGIEDIREAKRTCKRIFYRAMKGYGYRFTKIGWRHETVALAGDVERAFHCAQRGITPGIAPPRCVIEMKAMRTGAPSLKHPERTCTIRGCTRTVTRHSAKYGFICNTCARAITVNRRRGVDELEGLPLSKEKVVAKTYKPCFLCQKLLLVPLSLAKANRVKCRGACGSSGSQHYERWPPKKPQQPGRRRSGRLSEQS